MYEGDAPLAERRAGALTLDRDLLRELLGPGGAARAARPGRAGRSRAVAPGAGRRTPGDDRRPGVHDLLRRLGDLSSGRGGGRGRRGPSDRASLARRAGGRAVVPSGSGSPARTAGSRSRTSPATATASASTPPVGVPEAFLGPAAGCARRPARPMGPHPRSVPDPRARLDAGACPSGSSRTRWSDCSAPARSCVASSGRAVPSANGATRTCCGSSAVGRWRGCVARSSRSIRPRWAGSCPPGTASRRSAARCGPAPFRGSAALERLAEVVDQLAGVADPRLGAGAGRAAGAGPGLPAAPPRRARRDGRGRAGSGAGSSAGTTAGSRCSARAARRCGPTGGCRRRPGVASGGPRHDEIREHLRTRGASFYRELHAPPGGGSDREMLDALWDLVWAGEVTNDTFAPLRALRWKRPTGGRRRRPPRRPGRLTALGPPEAAGRWSLVEPADATSPADRAAARPGTGPARAARRADPRGGRRGGARGRVLGRLPDPPGARGGRPDPARLLRRWAGRRAVRAGGRARPAARRCASRRRRQRGAAVHLLAAADPANPYGAALPWPRRGDDDRRPFQRAAGRLRRAGRRGRRRCTSSAAARRSRRCPAADDPEVAGSRPSRRSRAWSIDGRVRELVIRKVDGEPVADIAVPRRACSRPASSPAIAGSRSAAALSARTADARRRHALPDRGRAAAVPRRARRCRAARAQGPGRSRRSSASSASASTRSRPRARTC